MPTDAGEGPGAFPGNRSQGMGDTGIGRVGTYRITNLRGLPIEITGKRTKQITKQASAARLQAPNINKRSQRLTVQVLVSGPRT